MLFRMQKKEDYQIIERINNMSSLLVKIKQYYENNKNSENNMFIDGYLNSSEYILFRLVDKLDHQDNEQEETLF